VLAVSALVGLSLARFVTRPLRKLERAAAEFGAGAFDARAPEREGPPEVRSLARVFNETAAKLGQLLRTQDEFVADASHQLRTPLTALRLRLETGDLAGGLREVERLGGLVEELLAFARADARPAALVDAAGIVRERVDYWRPLGDEQAIALVADTDGAATAYASRERLAQVLDNILSNAFDVAPRESTVSVSVRSARPWVEIRVRDHGPGMSSEARNHAFERFWSATGEGAGIGLAIARRLVETDEGEIELLDAAGGGLEVLVRLRGG
jgi:signal transduction histidine kinase